MGFCSICRNVDPWPDASSPWTQCNPIDANQGPRWIGTIGRRRVISSSCQLVEILLRIASPTIL